MSTANWFSAAITAPELLKLHQSTHNPMTKHIEYIESYQIHRKFWFAYLREFIQPHSWNLARFKDSSTLFIGRCRSLANLNKKLQNTSKTVFFWSLNIKSFLPFGFSRAVCFFADLYFRGLVFSCFLDWMVKRPFQESVHSYDI